MTAKSRPEKKFTNSMEIKTMLLSLRNVRFGDGPLANLNVTAPILDIKCVLLCETVNEGQGCFLAFALPQCIKALEELL
jgi:hypothetical protein